MEERRPQIRQRREFSQQSAELPEDSKEKDIQRRHKTRQKQLLDYYRRIETESLPEKLKTSTVTYHAEPQVLLFDEDEDWIDRFVPDKKKLPLKSSLRRKRNSHRNSKRSSLVIPSNRSISPTNHSSSPTNRPVSPVKQLVQQTSSDSLDPRIRPRQNIPQRIRNQPSSRSTQDENTINHATSDESLDKTRLDEDDKRELRRLEYAKKRQQRLGQEEPTSPTVPDNNSLTSSSSDDHRIQKLLLDLQEKEDRLRLFSDQMQEKDILIKSSEDRIRGLSKELGIKTNREADLIKRLQDSEFRMNGMTSSLSNLRNSIAEQEKLMKEKLLDAESKTAGLNNSFNDFRNMSSSREQELVKKLQEAESKVSRYTNSLNEFKNISSSDLTKARENEMNLSKENSEILVKLNETTNALHLKEEEAKKSKEIINGMANRLGNIERELFASKNLVVEREKRCNQLIRDIKMFQQKEKDLILKSEETEENFKKELTVAIAISDKLKLDFENLSHDKAAIFEEGETLKNKLRNLEIELDMKSENIAKFTAQIEALNQTITENNIQNELNDSKISSLSQELSSSELKVRGLNEQISILQESHGGDMAAALQRAETHQQELQDISQDRNRLQQRLNELESVLKRLAQDRDAWRNRVGELDSLMVKLKRENSESLSSIQSSHDEIIQNFTQEQVKLNSDISALKEVINEWETKYASLDSEYNRSSSASTRRISEMEESIVEFELKIEELSAGVKPFVLKLEEAENVESELRSQVSELQSKIESQNEEISELQAEMASIENELEAAITSKDALEIKTSKNQAALKKLKNELADANRTADSNMEQIKHDYEHSLLRLHDETQSSFRHLKSETESLLNVLSQRKSQDFEDSDGDSTLVDVDLISDDITKCRQLAVAMLVNFDSSKKALDEELNSLKAQSDILKKDLNSSSKNLEVIEFELQESKQSDDRQRQRIKVLEIQLAQLQKEKERVEESMKNNDETELIAALQQEIISVTGELNKKNQLLKKSTPAEFQAHIESIQTEVDAAIKAKLSAESDAIRLKDVVKNLEEKLVISKSDMDYVKSEADATVNREKHQAELFKSELLELRAKHRDLEEEFETTKTALIEMEKSMKELDETKTQTIKNMEGQHGQKLMSDLKKIEMLNQKLEACEAEILDLTKQLNDSQLACEDANADMEDLLENISHMKAQFTSMQEENENKKFEREELIHTLENRLSEEKSRLEALSSENDSASELQKQVIDLQTEIASLTFKLEEKESLMNSDATETTVLKAEIDSLKTEIVTLREVLLKVESSVAEKAKIIENLENELESLGVKFQDANAKLQIYEAEISDCKSKLQVYESESSASQNTNDTKSPDTSVLENNLNMKQKLIEELSLQLNEFTGTIESNREEIENLKKKVESLSLVSSHDNNFSNNFSAEFEDIKARLEAKEAIITSISIQLENSLAEVMTLKEELSSANEKIQHQDGISVVYLKEIEILKSTIEGAKPNSSELLELKTEIELKNNEIVKNLESIENLRNELDSTRSEMDGLQVSLKGTINHLLEDLQREREKNNGSEVENIVFSDGSDAVGSNSRPTSADKGKASGFLGGLFGRR